MKQLKSLSALFMALSLLFFLGCAATATRESTGEYIDDSVVTAKVKEAIIREPTLKSFEIKVVTYKGVVQLSGFVSSQSNIDKAVEIASGVNGVKSVKNDMLTK